MTVTAIDEAFARQRVRQDPVAVEVIHAADKALLIESRELAIESREYCMTAGEACARISRSLRQYGEVDGASRR